MNMCKSVYMKIKDLQNKLDKIEEGCSGCGPKAEPIENCTTCKHKTYEFEEGKVRCALWRCFTADNIRCQYYG